MTELQAQILLHNLAQTEKTHPLYIRSEITLLEISRRCRIPPEETIKLIKQLAGE